MLRKKQRIWCCVIACILFMTSMYTTYVKADNFAERAAFFELSRLHIAETQEGSVAQLRRNDQVTIQEDVCIVENKTSNVRTLLGRTTSRTTNVRKDLRFVGVLIWASILADFILRHYRIEEILYFHRLEYQESLIKYMHDIDGKKREPYLI